jgi:hypothetical protein
VSAPEDALALLAEHEQCELCFEFNYATACDGSIVTGYDSIASARRIHLARVLAAYVEEVLADARKETR